MCHDAMAKDVTSPLAQAPPQLSNKVWFSSVWVSDSQLVVVVVVIVVAVVHSHPFRFGRRANLAGLQ
jgi:hypothetical protein